MFNKVKHTYSRKTKQNQNVVHRAFQLFSSDDAFDRLVNKDTQNKTKDLFSGQSGNRNFFSKHGNAWRDRNDNSDCIIFINKSEVSNPLFKDLDDKYNMSVTPCKGRKRNPKNHKIYTNKVKKKKKKRKILNTLEKSETTPKRSNHIICSSTPIRLEKAMLVELGFSPIADPFKASSLYSNTSKTNNVLSSITDDFVLQFNKLQLDVSGKKDNDLLSDNRESQIDIKKDPISKSNYINLLPAKEWRRSLLKLKKSETSATRVFKNGRKSSTSTLIAKLNNHRKMIGPEESFINVSIQAMDQETKSNKIDTKRDFKELKFNLGNPVRRTTMWKRPTNLFEIKEIDIPNDHQFSDSYKKFAQSVNISDKNELMSVGSDIDEIKFKNQITTRRKPVFNKLIAEKPVHDSSYSQSISDRVVDDKSKLNLSKQITEKGEVSYNKVNLKSNELISESGVDDKSKLHLNNKITEMEKSYHEVSLRSNELISDVDSARSKSNCNNLILVKTPTLDIPYTKSYCELQTNNNDSTILFSSLTESSDNSSNNVEVTGKVFGDVPNFSGKKSLETSKSMEIFKGFDIDNHSSPILNSYAETSQPEDTNNVRYLDSSTRRDLESHSSKTRNQNDLSICSTPSIKESSIECAAKVEASDNTKAEEMMQSILTEANNFEITSQNDTPEQNYVTERKSKIGGLDYREMQKSKLEFVIKRSDVEENEEFYSSDPILFDSEEEFVEDPNDVISITQNKTNTNHKIEEPSGNITPINTFGLRNLDNKEKLHYLSPKDNNSFQSLHQSKTELSNESFKSWSSEPDIEKLSLNKDTIYTSEADESEVYSSFDEVKSENSVCVDEFKENVSLQSSYGLSDVWPSNENEVAFRCILHRCGQDKLVNFTDAFPDDELRNSKKVGEGVYGEVFLVQRASDPEDSVVKIIPVQGNQIVNGEVQKTYSEIISELIISQELGMLEDSEDCITDSFCKVKELWCLQGKYPLRLQELWDEYDKRIGSENDSPKMFQQSQEYIALELGHGGQAIAEYKFSSARQTFSIFLQTSFALAVAEVCFEFEHRDLHWGNVLVKKTKSKFSKFTVEGETYSIPTYGVKATIIDYTLSRMLYAGSVNFNDLSLDPDMFKGTGDYQFDIYRIMQQLLCDDWSRFVPKTNVQWLDYMIDKLIKGVSYTNQNSKLHFKFLTKLEKLRNIMADFESAYDFADYLANVFTETREIISQDVNISQS